MSSLLGGFEDFIEATSNTEFDERPVELREFLYSDEYMSLPPLSEYQEKLIEAMTQIYKYETLVDLYGEEEAMRLRHLNYKEIIFQLGKGSGKDYSTSIAFARIIYLLLCLKDPAAYYGKPSGDSIALLNVAVNAKQAKEVFFKNLKQRIQHCDWFNGKWDATQDTMSFDKNITAYSGHSEREAWEGYNLLVVVLDEIAAFATEEETTGDNRVRAKTAESIYNMYKASVSSRFPKYGKLALLSFPRYKGDFIQKRYEEVIAEKHTQVVKHKFKMIEELPDGAEDNEFEIEYEIDEIISYREPNVFALRRPTWYINPLIDIDDLKSDFWRNLEDSLSRFACMPPDAIDAFFKDKEKIAKAFPEHRPGPFYDDWSVRESFKPEAGAEYYMHIDLAYKHDRAAVALAHVSEWVTVTYDKWKNVAPVVQLDAVRYWTPTLSQNVDFSDIENYILMLIRMGFKIRLVTFDQWNSATVRQRLEQSYNITTDLLSVAKPHYEDLAVVLSEERLRGYDLPLAKTELAALKVIRGNKVDHTRSGSKDVSDAIAGAVYNAVKHTPQNANQKIEVHYLSAPTREEEPKKPEPVKVIPKDLREYLDRMQVL